MKMRYRIVSIDAADIREFLKPWEMFDTFEDAQQELLRRMARAQPTADGVVNTTWIVQSVKE